MQEEACPPRLKTYHQVCPIIKPVILLESSMATGFYSQMWFFSNGVLSTVFLLLVWNFFQWETKNWKLNKMISHGITRWQGSPIPNNDIAGYVTLCSSILLLSRNYNILKKGHSKWQKWRSRIFPMTNGRKSSTYIVWTMQMRFCSSLYKPRSIFWV